MSNQLPSCWKMNEETRKAMRHELYWSETRGELIFHVRFQIARILLQSS